MEYLKHDANLEIALYLEHTKLFYRVMNYMGHVRIFYGEVIFRATVFLIDLFCDRPQNEMI